MPKNFLEKSCLRIKSINRKSRTGIRNRFGHRDEPFSIPIPSTISVPNTAFNFKPSSRGGSWRLIMGRAHECGGSTRKAPTRCNSDTRLCTYNNRSSPYSASVGLSNGPEPTDCIPPPPPPSCIIPQTTTSDTFTVARKWKQSRTEPHRHLNKPTFLHIGHTYHLPPAEPPARRTTSVF